MVNGHNALGRSMPDQKQSLKLSLNATPRARERIVQTFPPGGSTAAPLNLSYRLGKVKALGILTGHWLDCGCADGGYTAGLIRHGAGSAIGVDVIGDRIAEAKKTFGGRTDLAFVHATHDRLPFADQTFDGVLLNEVLEHVHDERRTLVDIFRVLRRGGSLVIMSPNRWFPFEGHGAQIGTLKLGFPVPLLPWLPSRLTQRFLHARNYWPGEIEDLTRSAGFDVERVDFVLPVLENYRWLPAWALPRYQALIPKLDRMAAVKRFGVSVFVHARRP